MPVRAKSDINKEHFVFILIRVLVAMEKQIIFLWAYAYFRLIKEDENGQSRSD